MRNQNREDYLRAIYVIAEKNEGKVRSIDISKYLKISKSSVAEMLKKMKEEGDIEMAPYSHLSLSKKGLRKARVLTYKHRISELFLRDVLKMEEKDLHAEAHKLEHVLSDAVVKKMEELLGHPKKCPCGHEIPNTPQ